MVRGNRELIAGLVRDPQFGPCVMLGVGGVLAEAIGDVAFRVVPLTEARRRRRSSTTSRPQELLGAFRGEPAGRPGRARRGAAPACRGSRANAPTSWRSTSTRSSSSTAGRSRSTRSSRSTDAAPDAHVEHHGASADARRRGVRARCSSRAVSSSRARRRIPGKFGFVALHNILAAGYAGRVGATNLEGDAGARRRHRARASTSCPTARGTSCSCARPRRPTSTCCARARSGASAPRSSRAAGYGEAGRTGRRAERELVELADELGILLAGPNGQGVVSTPARLCAQIVAPYPPAGPHRDREPVGQLRVVVPELGGADRRRREPRGVAPGNAAAVGDRRLPRLVRRRRRDRGQPRVRRRCRRRARAVRAAARRRAPQAGRARQGRHDRAAASARRRATPDRSRPTTASSTACAAKPAITRAATIEEAFEAAATFATQPLPARSAHRGAHHRGRMGRRDRRRDRARPARSSSRRCPTTSAPRSTRSCRRGGAGTTRSTSRAARRATRSPR